MVTIEARLQGIWSEIVVRKPSLWVETTHSISVARREQTTMLLEEGDQAGLKADGMIPQGGSEIENAQEKQHLTEHHSERGNRN